MSGIPQVYVWTDGSARPNNGNGKGGWAAILIAGNNGNNHIRLLVGKQERATNNEMEARAVLEVLKRLKTPCYVLLHTDSTYVESGLRAIAQGRMLETNKHIWTELEPYYRKQIAVRVDTIKAHQHDTDDYNRLCDRLSKGVARRKEKPRDVYLSEQELVELLHGKSYF